MKIQCIVVLFYLAAETRLDIRQKVTSMIHWILAMILIICCQAVTGCVQWELQMAPAVIGQMTGILPGLGILLIGKLTDQAIGYGDGFVMIVCGLTLGFRNSVSMLMIALLAVMPAALFQLCVTGTDRKKEIPFLPYLTFAYLVLLLILDL